MKIELDIIDKLYLQGILKNKKPANETESRLIKNLLLKIK